ncbi:MAG TPA: HD domain-containing phosphohydrolase [Kofleriaceae bacterium]
MMVASTGPAPRVLFVDDEPSVLEAVAVNLRRGFEVFTAVSGESGLEHLRAYPDVAVIVSDMRMPKMDGAAFLSRAKEVAPNAVRILLTGQADIDATIRAVNQGQIFRFLTKPCPRDTLRGAIDSAVQQHRLIHAEKVLLEQTLRGSVKMLIDVLAIASPAAFGRANQIKTRVLDLARELGLADSWQLEIAALASQLGAIVLPHELAEKLEHKLPLTAAEQDSVARAPAMTEQLLANIPRLEVVRAMLALHVAPPPRKVATDPTTQLVELGAHLLRIANDLEAVESSRSERAPSTYELLVQQAEHRGEVYDPEVLAAAKRLYHDRVLAPAARTVAAHHLVAGMVLAEDVRFATGNLLVARGYEITSSFIERIRNLPPGMFSGLFRITA